MAKSDEGKKKAIAEAMTLDWIGLNEFEPHELTWIAMWDKGESKFIAKPYPLISGRLRLLREDHKAGEKYYIGPPDVDSMCGPDGISEIEIPNPNEIDKETRKPVTDSGIRVVRVVETKRGKFWGTKIGKYEDLEKLETMAIARALRFAGYGFGFTSAEEMTEVVQKEEYRPPFEIDEEPQQKPQKEKKQPEQPQNNEPKETSGSHKKYMAFVTENAVFKNDEERHIWQKAIMGKESTKDWKDNDYKGALNLLEWRQGSANKNLVDEIMLYLAKKPLDVIKPFLEIYDIDKISDLKEGLELWKPIINCAILANKMKLKEPIELGKALLRAKGIPKLATTFVNSLGHKNIVGMNKMEVENWQKFLKQNLESYGKKATEPIDIDYILEGK